MFTGMLRATRYARTQECAAYLTSVDGRPRVSSEQNMFGGLHSKTQRKNTSLALALQVVAVEVTIRPPGNGANSCKCCLPNFDTTQHLLNSQGNTVLPKNSHQSPGHAPADVVAEHLLQDRLLRKRGTAALLGPLMPRLTPHLMF